MCVSHAQRLLTCRGAFLSQVNQTLDAILDKDVGADWAFKILQEGLQDAKKARLFPIVHSVSL